MPKGYADYDELLRDPEIDAVHINTPIPDHASLSIKALKAGKHVACTVPMGTSIEECRQIVEAQRKRWAKIKQAKAAARKPAAKQAAG